MAESTEDERKGAYIEVLSGKQKGTTIPVRFNPTEFSVEKSVTYGDQSIPGRASPITQFVSGEAETLSMELFFDTYEEGGDVRDKYTEKLDSLLAVDGKLHAPPVCLFHWGTFEYTCVLQSANKTFTMFRRNGTPVRARVNVTFKRYETPETEGKVETKESADKTKVWTVEPGDTLWIIAAEEYGDPRRWRPIATENDINDPRSIEPGRELVLPPLEA